MTTVQLVALRVGAILAARELEDELVRQGLVNSCLLATAILLKYIPEARIIRGYQGFEDKCAFRHVWLNVDGTVIDLAMSAFRRLVIGDNAFPEYTLYEADPGIHRLDLETPEERREAQYVEQDIDEVRDRGVEAYLAQCPYSWARTWTPSAEAFVYWNRARGSTLNDAA